MATEFGLLIIAAYLLGSVPAAYLAAKWFRGIDIREYGSGNVGATNLLALTSRRLAISVIIFDLGKGMAAVAAAHLAGMDLTQQVIVGLAAITGHNWPVFLHFNGGRGVLTTIGVAFILPVLNNVVPWGGMIALATFASIQLATHNTPLGVGAGIAALPVASWGVGEPLPLAWGYLAMYIMLALRRLVAPQPVGAVPIGKTKRLLNRLLFDRDIRDREAWRRWISRQRRKRGKGDVVK